MIPEKVSNSQFKRSVCCLLTVLLCMLLCTVHVFAEAGEQTEVHMGQTIKVGLKYGSTAVSRFTVGCDGGFCVANYSSNGNMPVLQTISATELEIAVNGGEVSVKDIATGDTVISGMTTENMILPLFYNEGYSISIDGTMYHGGVMFTPSGSDKINIINTVNIDQYVCGVLPSEIGSSSPIETIKAQAVAARSYALVSALEGGNHASYGFDVCPSTHCQVYRGLKSESEACNRAASETAGLCIYYEGKPVMAYYAKNSGGYTQNVEDVWSSRLGYLRAVPDPYCSPYLWEKTYSFSELESRLAADGKNVGTLTKVEITELAGNGNVKEVTFTGTEGSASYSKYTIRSFFGSSDVKSNLFRFNGTVKYVDVGEDGSIPVREKETPEDAAAKGVLMLKELFMLGANDFSGQIKADEVYVIGAGGEAKKVYADSGVGIYAVNAAGEKYLINDTGKPAKPNGEAGSSDYMTITTVEGSLNETSGSLRIVGLGYGHGIGMQQDGAIAMGKLGWSYDQILKYYYTGIEIR